MTGSEAPRGPLRSVLLVAGAAIGALTLVGGTQLYATRIAEHEAGTFAKAILYSAASWFVWAAAAPAIIWLARRYDFRPGRRGVSLAAHVVPFVLCHVTSSAAVLYAGMALYGTGGRVVSNRAIVQGVLASSRWQLSLLLYLTIMGLAWAADIWQRLRDREIQSARLEAQSAHARLQALGMRLQPHFLFNTLHTVGALIDEDPPQARRMLAKLGELLRDLLDDAGAVDVTLRDELALLRRYLEIEQLRFADRLQIVIDVPADLEDALVPRLLLQPLTENALRHGLAPLARGGTLRVTASGQGDILQLVVWNNGAPLIASHREGVGLATTRDRLATRHGAQGTLIMRGEPDGVCATVTLPLVRA